MEKGQGKVTDTLQTDNVFARKEYIERKTAYDTLTEYYHHSTDTQHGALREALSRVPSADVVPVRHRKWKIALLDHESFGVRPKVLYCSECHKCIAYPTNYCPNCGAKMEKDGDGDV